LLQSLESSDEGIDELMSIWMTECPSDPHGADALLQMEQDCSSGQEEATLRKIIQKHNKAWVEPMNRLSLLLFVKGEYDESRKWVNAVLEQKPWHFEGIQMQVLLTLASPSSNKKKRMASALTWARKGLPPLDHTKRRKEWVCRAVSQAQKALSDLEDEAFTVRHQVFSSGSFAVDQTVDSSSTWQ
jgi:hypothetical protein